MSTPSESRSARATAVRDDIAAAVRERVAALRTRRGPAVPDFPSRVQELVVVSSSSRSGSSMLTETLRHSDALLHLRAEINPHLRLAGLGFPDSGSGSDHLDAGHLRTLDPCWRQLLGEELALDAGNPADEVDDEQFVWDAAWRFVVQWPGLPFDPDTWWRTAQGVLTRLRRDRGWGPRELPEPDRFQVALLRALAARGVPVDPSYYDLPAALTGPASAAPPRFPGTAVVEEPPFVVTRPWRRATAADVAGKALVVKTPSNAYRWGFLRALFPNARLSVLHLTRNPAASINGLVDGWRHRGFHSHRMAEPLHIAGYTEDFPDRRWWWKFDLPPGWKRLAAGASLFEVCAFQWASAHRAVLDGVDPGADRYLRLRFEDLQAGPRQRLTCFARISRWLDIPFTGAFHRAARDGIGPVVATAPPAPGRWRTRADQVLAAIDPATRGVAERLGYGSDSSWT